MGEVESCDRATSFKTIPSQTDFYPYTVNR